MMVIEKAVGSDAELLRLAAVSAFFDDKRYRPAARGFEGPPGHDSIEAHTRWINMHDYFKCIVEGNIVGGCIVKKHTDHCELFGIFLHGSCMGKGIGSKLLREVMRMYPEGTHWSLETPDYAVRNHRFYERNGFIRAGKSKPDPGLGYGFITYRYKRDSDCH